MTSDPWPELFVASCALLRSTGLGSAASPPVPFSAFRDELGNEPANEILNGAAQLVSDERLQGLGRRGHAWSLRPVSGRPLEFSP
jgi:hypothetical protein